MVLRRTYSLALIVVICWAIPVMIGIAQEPAFSNTELYEIILEAQNSGDLTTLGNAYHDLAERDLSSTDNSDRAITNYLNSIEAFEEAGDSLNYYTTRLDLGRLYADQEYYNEALMHFMSCMDYFQEQKDTVMTARVMNQIGDIHLANNNIGEAIQFLENARALNVFAKDSLLTLINRFTLSTITKSGENVKDISDSLISLLAVRDSLNNTNFKSSILLNAGMYNMHLGKYSLAKYYLHRSEEAAKTNGAQLNDIYKQLAICYRKNDNSDMAYQYLDKYAQLNDSLHNVRRITIFNNLMATRKAQEQEARIRELQKDHFISKLSNRFQRIVSFSLLFGSLIVLLGTYLVIRFYQQKINTNQIINTQKGEITERRIRELENNLKIETMHSMIKGQEAERERIAKDLHDSLGGLLSTVKLHFDALQSKEPDVKGLSEYAKAHKLLDTACTEVRNISNNMQPGALLKLGIVPAINDLINRAKSDGMPNIDFQHYGLNGELDQTISLNIYRIIQELLNNALKHAQANEIMIQLVKKEDEVIVMVEDDGVGYENTQVKKGMGTANIASRVNYLKGDLSIHSVKGTGTTTMINIPVS